MAAPCRACVRSRSRRIAAVRRFYLCCALSGLRFAAAFLRPAGSPTPSKRVINDWPELTSLIMQARTEIEIAAPTEQTRHIVLLIAPTIFLSAFLLFCSEPMVGKMMLPLLGGAAAVWITCLLFFQLMLLAGYLYAHVLERYANVRAQMLAHACLMMVAIIFLRKPARLAGVSIFN